MTVEKISRIRQYYKSKTSKTIPNLDIITYTQQFPHKEHNAQKQFCVRGWISGFQFDVMVL